MRRNDKGSTIVLVIVVLAIVGILATVALWISLTNFQMKITDRNVTDNFYSAEGVLDQICTGLQGDASASMDGAYNTVMQRYASLSEDERTATFTSSYVYELRNRLRYSGGSAVIGGVTYASDMLCDLAKLKGYVSSDVLASADVKLYSASDDSTDYCVLSTTSYGLVIKDLVVEYTDDKGYLSIIQTDIALAIPDMNLINAQNVPNVFDYSIIGNGGVTIDGYGTKIGGSVYAGSDNAKDASLVSAADYESLVVSTTGTVDFSGASHVIADGDVVINGGVGTNDKLLTDPDGAFWARNLTVSGATAGLLGTSYLADDMTLSGTSPYVYFSAGTGTDQTLGSYFGYGTSTTDSALSSAIIINGTDAVLDLSGVDTMALGGYAYIGTSKIDSKSVDGITNGSNIQLGESISVKGDQIAYLIPTECIATVDGTSALFQNPISVGDYEKLVENPDIYTIVDADVTIRKTNKTLSSYLGGKSIADAYTKIVVPSKTGDPKDGLVYFYLNLDADNATQYFLDYYNADSKKLTRYTGFYTDGIQAFGENAQIYTAGTYVEYEEATNVDLSDLSYGIGTDAVNGGMGNLPSRYEALTTKLISDYSALSSEEIGKTVFSNIIQVDDLKNFLSTCPSKTYTTSVSTGDGGTYTLVLTDNAGGSAYIHTSGSATNSYLIIATGDVVVKADFVGTIIADGTVTVDNTANITMVPAATGNVKKLLGTECDNENGVTMKVYEFFKDGNAYMISGFVDSETTDSVTGDSSLVDLAQLITYQNWKKK